MNGGLCTRDIAGHSDRTFEVRNDDSTSQSKKRGYDSRAIILNILQVVREVNAFERWTSWILCSVTGL